MLAQLAFPLPITVIGDMLGIPQEDRRDFRTRTVHIAQTLEPLPPKEVQDRADEATAEFESYFRDLIDARRKKPGDDLFSALIEAEYSPVQLATPRVANAPIESAGHTIEPGQGVIAVVVGQIVIRLASRNPML